MAKPLSITEAIEPLVVDLWDNRYRSRTLTKTGINRADELREELGNTEDDDLDAAISIRAELLALSLEPIDGAREEVADLIREKYEADELSPANLEAIEGELFRRNNPFMRQFS